jgi:monooxygenase
VQRSIDQFPRQGLKSPWRLHQNYARDTALLRFGSLDDDALEFSAAAPAVAPAEPLAA